MPLLEQMVAQKMYPDGSRLEGLEDEVEVLPNAGDVVYYHPYLVHSASKNTNMQRPRKVCPQLCICGGHTVLCRRRR